MVRPLRLAAPLSCFATALPLLGHNVVRGATPTKYIAFLDSYIKLFEANQASRVQQMKHLSAGTDGCSTDWSDGWTIGSDGS